MLQNPPVVYPKFEERSISVKMNDSSVSSVSKKVVMKSQNDCQISKDSKDVIVNCHNHKVVHTSICDQSFAREDTVFLKMDDLVM